MFSLQLCDLKWQQERHQNRRGRRFLLVSRPQKSFSTPFGHLSNSQPQRRERTNPTAPRRKAAGPGPPGSPGRQAHKEDGLKKQRGESSMTRAKTSRCRAKSSSDRAAQTAGRSGDQGGSPARARGSAPARAHSGPPASNKPPAHGTYRCSHLTCRVPAGPAGVSGPRSPPRPILP